MTYDEMMLKTNDLIDVLERENKLLRRMKSLEAAHLIDEKLRLLAHYYRLLVQLKEDPHVLKEWPTDKRRNLLEKTQYLTTLAAENEQRLSIVNAANERLLKVITSILTEEKKTVEGYTAFGRVPIPQKKYHADPVSLSVNQIL